VAHLHRVLVGHVVRAHGIRGALRVRPTSGRADETARTLAGASELFLDEEPRHLRKVRPERADLLIELEGVNDRDRADALRGRAVLIERTQLPAPAENEVYLDDLVGCEVVDPRGLRLGVVRGSFHSGAHEVLILDCAGGERLLPYVAPMLISLDLPARRIVYDPPPGLLDPEDAELG
jgi:16S rRNA processing protein RimM